MPPREVIDHFGVTIPVEEVTNTMVLKMGVLDIDGDPGGSVTTTAGLGGTMVLITWGGRKFRVDLREVMSSVVGEIDRPNMQPLREGMGLART